MKKRTVLSELCKSMEETSNSSAELEIVIARQKVREYIKKDKDSYIQLKAEADFEPNATDSLGYVFSLLSFAISALTFIYSVTSFINPLAMTIIVAGALIGELLIALRMLDGFKLINKWRKYILAALAEINPEQLS